MAKGDRLIAVGQSASKAEKIDPFDAMNFLR